MASTNPARRSAMLLVPETASAMFVPSAAPSSSAVAAPSTRRPRASSIDVAEVSASVVRSSASPSAVAAPSAAASAPSAVTSSPSR
ncbi:MAG: hypothetical protein R2713_20345 [Ilumatobacteraceae bacterium]